MDPAVVPPTAPGRQLVWLLSLEAEPSAEEIGDHVVVAGQRPGDAGLASGLLSFGRTVRELPGVVTRSGEAGLCLELRRGAERLCVEVALDQGGSGKLAVVDLRAPRAEAEEVELDRIRLLYDRAAETYDEFAAGQAHYWDRARAWLRATVRDGFTVLDVGCGPASLVADLPAAIAVIGCDLSAEMVRRAGLARPTGTFVVHDYHRPFPTHWPRADVTIALGCLEFCSDLALTARNLAAATRPEGQLLLTVPRTQPGSPHEIGLPAFGVTLRLWEDAQVVAALGTSGLAVITHEVGPGFTSPGIATVEYGYWELKAPPA